MYLTVLKADRKSLLNRTKYVDYYHGNKMHKWLLEQQNASRESENLLYRVMPGDDEIFVYIYSKSKFNAGEAEKYGLKEIKAPDIKELIDQAEKRGSFSFDVLAIPQRRNKERSWFIKDPEERERWLKEKFERYGIDIDCVEYRLVNAVFGKDDRHSPSHGTCFKGVAHLRDDSRLSDVITNGIGRCKNYGAGMVLIKP